jgi:hypothetical protein
MTTDNVPSTLQHRTIGSGDHALEVSALGLGCMGMSEFYGTGDDLTALADAVPIDAVQGERYPDMSSIDR